MSQKMHVGDTDIKLQAAFSNLATGARITSISWASDDTGVATVTGSTDGTTATLHAVAAGDCTITVTATRFTGADITHGLPVTVWAAQDAEVGILVHPVNSAGFASG